MFERQQDREFAFGANTHDDCACPATSVGYTPDHSPYTEVAEAYDAMARENEEVDRGTIPEEEAKEYWLDAIAVVSDEREQAIRDEDWSFADMRGKEVEAGKEVAKELGWIDDE